MPQPQRRLSVLIKALNEEGRIAACLESVLVAVEGLDAEVVLVDSCSTDSTVEVASRYPVRVVQFAQQPDRSCGAAVQLAYQQAGGEFVYVLDGDMQMAPGFLRLALERLERDAGLAGVGGRLVDEVVRTETDHARARIAGMQVSEHEVDELGGGGLYRRAAIEQVGYLANRWLQACEEADLGVRLRASGWRLLRLPDLAVRHEGHAEGNGAMLLRLWRNGRAAAAGVMLRAALGRPWWPLALRRMWHLGIAPGLHGLGLLLALAGGWHWYAAPLLAWLLLQALRRRSPGAAWWSLVSAHVLFVASLRGFLRPPRDPGEPIPSRTLNQAAG
ncbi:glycosyltransferase [Pelomonas sp. KK5]|uniref:glycosyltransferase family 2 protein n=1 Tax=Pelomonas sp. KK5 TaxID=1855730 RepID=UPI00097BFD4C|nr:glycosyltransferase [Pelomonas sp. KK5]